MPWLHRLQQRLSITRNEALTLMSLSLFLMVGITGRHMCRQAAPIQLDAYAEVDSIFAAQSAISFETEGDDGHTYSDTVHSPHSTNASSDLNIISNPPAAPRADKSATTRRIDLNTATASELEQLPRIGPKMAERILAFRTTFGPLRSVDELQSVRGIGSKTLDLIRPHAYVSPHDTTE